jgi:HSP20 family protein
MYTTYDIFNDLNEIRSLFDNYFYDMPYSWRAADYPYVNLYEKDDNIELAVLAPGVKVEDVNLQLIDNSIMIEIEKKSDHKESPYIRKERSFGSYKKAVKLPFKVDPDKIEASMKDGILNVKLVKSEEAKPKKITIN